MAPPGKPLLEMNSPDCPQSPTEAERDLVVPLSVLLAPMRRAVAPKEVHQHLNRHQRHPTLPDEAALQTIPGHAQGGGGIELERVDSAGNDALAVSVVDVCTRPSGTRP